MEVEISGDTAEEASDFSIQSWDKERNLPTMG